MDLKSPNLRVYDAYIKTLILFINSLDKTEIFLNDYDCRKQKKDFFRA